MRDRIDDDADLVLFDEAVKCFTGAANRAAYVFAWVAAAESLLNKLDTMGAAQSNIGDFVKKFKAEQDAGAGKDASLLDQAQKVGFVNATEYKALDAVRDLRNQYGHPTSAAPTPLAAAGAIELAVDAVLSKPALLQHGGARQLAERVGTDTHYIPDDAAAIAGWTTARAALVADAARPLFVRTLVEQHAANLAQIDEALSERCRLVASHALAEWGADLTEARWTVDALAQAHGPSAAAVFTSSGPWDLLGEDDQYQLLSRCLEIPTTASEPKLTRRLLARAFELHAAGTLNDLQSKLVADRVQAIDGNWLVSAGAPVDLLLGKAVGFLNDDSFVENQKGTRILDAIAASVLATAGDPALGETGAALARSSRRGAYVARNLIGDVIRRPDAWPSSFRVALTVEGATQPCLFFDAVTARQSMRLALQGVVIATAVRDRVLEMLTGEPDVGHKADEAVEQVRERIADPGEDGIIDPDALEIVREVLDAVAARYAGVFGTDAAED